MLVAKLTNPGEGTVELPYPNYDSWMNANSVCRKAYIDGEVQAAFAKWKAPVEAATVAPITDTNPGSSFTTAVTPSTWTILHGTTNLVIDGVTINAIGQRILIQFETSFLFSSGVFVVTGITPSTSTTLVRSSDCDTVDKLYGATVYVKNGTVNAEKTITQINLSTALNNSPGVYIYKQISTPDLLSSKQIEDDSTIVDVADNTKQLRIDVGGITTATTRTANAQDFSGTLVMSEPASYVRFDNNSGGNQLFALNGGLGNTIGDRVTYVGGSGYPFFALQNWTNLSLVVGAISYEDFVTPIEVTGDVAYQLIPFPGTLQAGAFQITTNNLGRLTNADGLTWAFLINFSCSITGGNGTEWEIALFINGAKVSNPYVTTISANGRYTSLTGVWVQQLNGGVNGGIGPANQYCEIYVKRNTGSGNVTIGSAFLSVSALKLQNMPP